jgi:hypothetical protein
MDESAEVSAAPAPARAPASAPAPIRSGPPRSVLAAAAGIVALVVVAVVVAVALPDQPTSYPAGSPEAAFQGYYEAWEAGDIDAAYAHLSSDVARELTQDEYRRMDAEQSWQRQEDRRVVLLHSEITGDRAVLDLRVDQFYEGGLGGDRYSYERSVRLVREDGVWLVDEPLVGIESSGYGY